jgi:hypothetical protein
MKKTAFTLASVVALVFLGACDRQPFEVTKKLHEPYQQHHGDDHGKGDAHGKADAHGEHGDKKAH